MKIYKIYEMPKNPTENGKYIEQTPILKRAQEAVENSNKDLFIKVFEDGKETEILIKSDWQNKKMTNTEAKKIAKDALMSALSAAYYPLSDSGEYTDEEMELISKYMHKYGEAMGKAIRREFYTT